MTDHHGEDWETAFIRVLQEELGPDFVVHDSDTGRELWVEHDRLPNGQTSVCVDCEPFSVVWALRKLLRPEAPTDA